jgi:hypothetical protein
MPEHNTPYPTGGRPGGAAHGGQAPPPPQPSPPRPRPGAHAGSGTYGRQPVPMAHPKTTYMGFYFWWWLGVTALFTLAGLFCFAHGAVGAGFVGLATAGLSALYVRYLFRGGRLRMIFIIF